MSDIFRLIRANIERTRKEENVKETNLVKKSNKMDGINLDSFIIGEGENKFQKPNPKKSKSIELDKVDIFEQEIGEDFETKDYLADIEQIDYLKLDKMPKEKQLRLLKKEYLVLLDRIKEVSGEFTKVDKSFKEQSVEFHNMKTTISKLKEFIRIIGTMIPDGVELKTKLEAPSWSIDEIEDEMISRLNFVINRAKNADDYVEQETVDLSNQIQGLKNKLTKVENHNLELEQEIDKLYDQLENASFPQEQEEETLEEPIYIDESEYDADHDEEYDDNGNEYFNISDTYETNNYNSDEEEEDYEEDEYEETNQPVAYEEEEEESFTLGGYDNSPKEEKNDFDELYSQEYGDLFEDEEEEVVEPPKRFQPQSTPNRNQNSRTQNERPTSNRRNTNEKPAPTPKSSPSSKPTRKPAENNRPAREEQTRKTSPQQSNSNRKPTNRSDQNSTPSRNQRQEQVAPNKKQERPSSNRPVREVEAKRDSNSPSKSTTSSNSRPNSSRPAERPSRQNPKAEEKTQTRERPQRQERPTRPQRTRPSRPEPVEEEVVLTNKLERDDTYDPTQAIDVDPYLESLSEDAKFIIKMIGEVGVSRNTELKDLLSEREDAKPLFFHGTKFQKNNMNNAVNDLINAQILTNDQIKLGSRGGIFKIYELTDLGKHIYFALTNEVPVKSELALLIRQHASAEHGFLIKDSAAIFKEMGYTVHTERKDLRRDVSGGKHKSFDLIIEKGDETCYIEVERGTHNDEDFYVAMDKIREVTQQFYFICPNEDILFSKTKRQFFLWVQKHLGGMDQAKGIQANFTTFGKLKEGKKPLWDDINL